LTIGAVLAGVSTTGVPTSTTSARCRQAGRPAGTIDARPRGGLDQTTPKRAAHGAEAQSMRDLAVVSTGSGSEVDFGECRGTIDARRETSRWSRHALRRSRRARGGTAQSMRDLGGLDTGIAPILGALHGVTINRCETSRWSRHPDGWDAARVARGTIDARPRWSRLGRTGIAGRGA